MMDQLYLGIQVKEITERLNELKIALIVLGVILIGLIAVLVIDFIKNRRDEKARWADYHARLDEQKRKAYWDADPSIQKFRENYAKSQQVTSRSTKPGVRYPAKPLKARKSDDYEVVGTGDTFDGYWVDDSNDRVSGWTSTSDDTSNSSWGSSTTNYTSSDSNSSSGYTSSSSSDSGSSSSSSSYDSGSSSTSSSDF